MKKITYFTLVLLTIILLSSCTFHFPYDYEITGRQHKIVFKIIPEDALLLLNGKMIGEVYEFSTWESALTLSSKNNEIIVKRHGYVEEVIDLYEYSGREFIIEVNLKREKNYRMQKTIIKKSELKQKDIDQEQSEIGVAVKPKEFKDSETKPEIDSSVFRKTTLSILVTPPDAAIYINKKFWGISPESGKINTVLKKGKYSIEVIKPGYTSIERIITISGQKKNLEIKIALTKK